MQKYLLIILTVVFSLGCLLAVPQFSLAQEKDYGLKDTATAAGLPNEEVDVTQEIGRVIGIALSFIGVLFFGLMLYAGFIWMMARGNDQEVTKAKHIIFSAILGLVVVIGSYAITKFVLDFLLKQQS
ncbi:hypothetical protein COT95_00500 [Candidatus Falkowbacteria bacterium CG10_big_fil_rev_8_21_14_0_10_37_6]|uniref:TrbC/VIRB2 family protein n=1 Tax=Candidatus Falkowbacteria bacterium CG10_big_fil_rev_8_21_14_0_10_37_6 TaxID=1974563 RepID=A0A2H0V7M9_9BACT|nr:MAG: hypothetical protein COT95_00500 [Candidatus Falkowbacteria bacterium CG10_big_fil_rev_8_21_14_0_10_37_6]